MNLVYDTKISKSEKNVMDIATKRLINHIEKYTYDEIKRMHVDDYLIHKKFVFSGECFFIFKTVVVKQQLRILCYIAENQLVIITFYIKKNSKYKYYEDFKDIAHNYYLSLEKKR